MALQSHTTNTPTVVSESSEISRVYVEGLVAGLIGAATIAVWFFILDLYNGRPFYTPNVLGAALSLSGAVRNLRRFRSRWSSSYSILGFTV